MITVYRRHVSDNLPNILGLHTPKSDTASKVSFYTILVMTTTALPVKAVVLWKVKVPVFWSFDPQLVGKYYISVK